MIDSQINTRIESVLSLLNPILTKQMHSTFVLSEWGMKKKSDKHVQLLQDFELLALYMLMVDWKTYECNTFNLSLDEDDCPVPFYPSQKADEETIECIRTYFDCTYNVCVDPILEAFAMYPLGEIPKGIAYMWIDQAPICDNNIFEIDKQ